MAQKVIKARTWESNQSWYHETTTKIDGHTLKASIRRNAYDHQSSAKVLRWDGNEWQCVCQRPIEECCCYEVSYVQKNITNRHFLADVDSMFKEAMEILE